MNKQFKRYGAALGLSGLSMGSAMAALPEGAAAAISTYQTDVLAALALVIAAGIAIYGLKKLGSKMGWL